MNQEKKEEILKWYEKANHDIKNASIVVSAHPDILDTACFHCQQAIEKYLKAYLVYQGKDIKKTHNLRFLQRSCAEYDSDFENLDFKNLTAFAIELRYPADALTPPIEEVKEYLQMAENIRELVLKKVIFT